MVARTPIKALETRYAGCRFRSRLEARWAVFFDGLGIDWDYEPEGYKIGNCDRTAPNYYLPDFYLPRTKQWVEVKPTDELLDKGLMIRCVDTWAADPLPGLDMSQLDDARGLLILGSIPRPRVDCVPSFTILGHCKGVFHQRTIIHSDGEGSYQIIRNGGGEYHERCSPGLDVTIGPAAADMLNGCECDWVKTWYGQVPVTGTPLARKVNAALTAARSARFGH